MLSLELIDAGLVLAQRNGDATALLSDTPGIAVLEEAVTLTGTAAAARVRLKPLLAQSNYWRALNTAPLTRPSRLIGTTADLAFAQLQSLFAGTESSSEGVLLAIPAGYSREQLGLLLGIVNETKVPVAGLVDAALAACSHEPAPPRVLHLELELHQALLTILEYTGGERAGLKRSRYESVPRYGLLAFQQAAMRFIADSFVRKTRFDPLHEAINEQRLLDQLPQWLAQLVAEENATISIQAGERTLEIELNRAEFIAAVESHYVELLRLVQNARVAGMPIALRLSQRVAAMPGLLERFTSLRDCEVQVLPQGAAALGALKYADAIRRSPESLALVYQLPTPPAEGVTSLRDDHSTPPQLRPTHVLFQGRAWALSEKPLTVGWSTEGVQRGLQLPTAAPGISRAHCTLSRRNGAVLVEDHSTYGSYVNDERVVGRTVLTVGDRLRLGTPGVTLELIQLVRDDGAPQD
jgi:hypothetical protein